MQELNVQVSNLWYVFIVDRFAVIYTSFISSFLPQDKVAEFARMSPQQLLRETQRAAGNANLTSWHDTLIDAGNEYKSAKEVSNIHMVSRALSLSFSIAYGCRPVTAQEYGRAQRQPRA